MWCSKTSVFLIIISFLLVSYYNWFCWKLRFLILRVIFNRAVFPMQVAEVFVVFGVLVVVERIQALVCLDWHLVEPSWLLLLLAEILELLKVIWTHVFNHAIIDFGRCLISILIFSNKVQRLQICDLLRIERYLLPIFVNNSQLIFFSNGVDNSRGIVNHSVLTATNTAVFGARNRPLWKCASGACIIL